MKIHAIFYLLTLFLLCQCTINEVGPPGEDGGFDLELRFSLGSQTKTTAAEDSLRVDARYDLVRFDKRNYLEVDSIVFGSRMRSEIDQDTCLVFLYNVTNNIVISGARLQSDTTAFEWRYSGNIYNALPSRPIDLGVLLVSKKTGAVVEGGQSILFLYRRNE